MERRTFLGGTGALFLAMPLTVQAQQAKKMWRIVSMREDFTTSPPWARGHSSIG